uniref:Chemokine interleukin-8-like domain-containing protein n=1 Tax=Sander lucioperca TaxID=283035 RepID=A0A8C9YHI7_SANLU
MSSFVKILLLLAVMVCMSKAHGLNQSEHCLCQHVRNRIGSKTDIKDIQIYPATIFCGKVEIVVTINSGLRYCLNPKLKATLIQASSSEYTDHPTINIKRSVNLHI